MRIATANERQLSEARNLRESLEKLIADITADTAASSVADEILYHATQLLPFIAKNERVLATAVGAEEHRRRKLNPGVQF